MTNSKNILVAPLNWGLGHATRCIPIIIALQENGFTPIIASDGEGLTLLQKEFPLLEYIILPSYHIKYPKKGNHFKLKLLLSIPRLIHSVLKEKKLINKLIDSKNISGIISDNRFGVYSNKIPSVYITHQLTVFSGNTTWLSSKLHQSIARKFNECWIPDSNGNQNYSGKLGHPTTNISKLKYIGILTRFKKANPPKKYDYLIVLSGPEPQRSILENILLQQLKNSSKNILFIKGKIENKQTIVVKDNITVYNFMTSNELETAIHKSEVVISRSGYTTIMDLAKTNKKAFFIPTPGQFEQLYLAKRLKRLNIAPYALQENFSIDKLDEISNYIGLSEIENTTNFSELFSIFNTH